MKRKRKRRKNERSESEKRVGPEYDRENIDEGAKSRSRRL
jgi:hypothetical protein